MSCMIGIDIGTSGVKTLVVTETGKIVAQATAEYPLYHPKAGWAEQDPEDWWQATLTTLKKIGEDLGSDADRVKAIGLSGQMHGSVFLDKSGNVLRPAILWCDVRTADQCRYITETVGRDELIRHTSNPALEGFTAPKIVWLQQNEPDVYRQVAKVLLPKDYVRYRLTGEIFTEMSDAAGSLLLDVTHRRWSEPVLQALNIDPEILPECRESIDVCGTLTQQVAESTGLPAGIPVAGGGADNACGATGAGIVRPGRVLSSIGSSGVIVVHTDQPQTDPQGKVHTFNHAIPHRWYVMGVIMAAGLSLKWFRDNLGHLEKQMESLTGTDAYDLMSAQAAPTPPGAEGLVFLPYLNGERTPHADAYARGVFFGLTPRHTRGHLIRAVMEGVVYALRDSVEIIRAMGIPIEQVRAIGGGAKSPLWRQMQADIMQLEVATLNIDEGPAFGAALLAGVCAQVYSSVEEAAENTVRIVHTTEPNRDLTRLYDDYYQLFRSLYPALKDRFREAAQLEI
ncbi:MAG: xylulokinase [Firmicutes bacterium]|nr:xylulokinase [Bacillota bacterium]